LLMGGIEGRLFREFAMTLSSAVMISLVVSLTTTPMMCAYVLPQRREQDHGKLYRVTERAFYRMLDIYDRSLRWALRCPALIMVSLLVTVGAAVYLFVNIPKDFVPRQDNGLISGGMQADRSVSFQLMEKKLAQLVDVIRRDPAVANVDGFYYGGSYADVFVVLKPLADRQVSAQQVVRRVRKELDWIAGTEVYLGSAQDVRIGGRASNAQYQFTLNGED